MSSARRRAEEPTDGGYSLRQVAALSGVREADVRAWVRAGLVTPAEAEGAPRFAFQDLVLLRALARLEGQAIAEAPRPATTRRRVRRALRRLSKRLGPGARLSALQLQAAEGRLVVRAEGAQLDAESGQGLFDFSAKDVRPAAGVVSHLAPRPVEVDATTWYERACDLEGEAPSEAQLAYRRALAADPAHADAHVNLGRLLHEAGDVEGARAEYAAALALRPADAIAAFNLGCALEDLGRSALAVTAYEQALEVDARCADAHHNLALLHERAGRAREAIRHLAAYRRLVGRPYDSAD